MWSIEVKILDRPCWKPCWAVDLGYIPMSQRYQSLWHLNNNDMQTDLMAQRLAHRAEDREVPGSSPTQD